MQLYFYLLTLKEKGINVRGEVLFPEEKKKIQLELNENMERELHRAITHIKQIIHEDTPPPKTRISYCKSCAYEELCFA